jgi:hypothetical protein
VPISDGLLANEGFVKICRPIVQVNDLSFALEARYFSAAKKKYRQIALRLVVLVSNLIWW